jgi:hypothetical protein
VPNERRVQMGLVLLVLALLDLGAIWVLVNPPITDEISQGYLLSSRVISCAGCAVIGGWLLWRAWVNHRGRT